MKNLALILSSIVLSACAAGGGSGAAPASGPAVVAPVQPTPTPAPTPVSLTYYSVTHSVDAVPFTGSCVVYNSNGYCWDDGIKAVPVGHSYSFWQVTSPSGHCGGNCTTDLLSSSPTLVDGALLSDMVNALHSETPSTVLANGVPTNVTCTIEGETLDCVDFQIDLNQVPL